MRVLVATDLSAAADVALREGASLAGAGDVLSVVHVLPFLQRESLFVPVRDEIFEARATKIVERATAAVHERVAKLAPRASETFIDEGFDYAAIIQRAEAWRADIIVVGSHGHSRLSHLLGDVAIKVVRHAHCPVLVARECAQHGWVLAATDLSEPSLPAVAAGATEAHRRNAKLKVVQAIGFLDVEAAYLLELATPSIPDGTPEREVMAEALRAAVARSGAEATCALLDAPAAAAIVRDAAAMGAELIVVGSHGRTGLARLALGSVAEKVVRAAACSVLVVRRAAP